ncbi:hypothetical protein CK203_112885 [Vitis vinifera]|uniref:Retrotransposon Copia-like N-terminal domain-containing protein n=1 Tax=Vitis vinifera TaxID=29760 RepID=A0A438F1B0_VITVI|nr:hypothetical protein CK203_112885 [Vitis vinifera]
MVSEQFLLLILCGDHPRLILVSHNLIGNNYNTWSKAMAMTLTSKNKIGFIDGTIPRAAQADILFNAWNRYNNMVTSWIINSVSKDIADSLMYIATVAKIWIDPFKVLWEEVKNFQPLPVCHCGGLQVWLEYQQQENVIEFLMGLNDSYAQTRGQILMMEPLPPLSKLQRENMRGLNVAIVDCRVIPLIVVTNCMDTHLGLYAGADDWDGVLPSSHANTFRSLFPSFIDYNPATTIESPVSFISRLTRVTRPPTYLQDYHYYSTTLTSTSTSYPLSGVPGYDKLSPSHRALVHAISSHVEPTSYTQATMISEWQ